MVKDYPSYLPEDFKGEESIQEGNQRYYYKTKNGQNLLIGSIVGKRHLVIRFPEGSTIDVIPKDSVGTNEIIDGGVHQEDLDPNIEAADGDIDSIFDHQPQNSGGSGGFPDEMQEEEGD
jgi:hypothetical protein